MTAKDDLEPKASRPGWKTLVFAIVAALALGVIYNWSDISAVAHWSEIEHALGLG